MAPALAPLALRRLALAVVLVGVAATTALVAIGVTYGSTIAATRDELADRALRRAAIAEALAQATGDPENALRVFLAEQRRMRGGERTSEQVVIGATRAGRAVLLLQHGSDGELRPLPVSLAQGRGDPMLRALAGKTGSMTARDYAGVPVLAAYRPVPALGWGIVAKIDLAEVRAPFWRAAGATAGATLLLAVAGLLAFARLTEPMIRELQGRERLLDAVLETMPIGVWIADAAGRIVRGNAAGQRIWQGVRYVAPDQYSLYRGWWRSSGAPIAAEEWALARAVQRGEVSTDEEIEIECFDGTRKVIHNCGAPLRDADGTISGGIATNLDITDRVRAEERLADALTELERSNRDLQQFAYVAAHDLQEPARMVVAHLSLLERRLGDALDERGRTFLGYAVDGGRRMQRLIQDLLAYSRVQTRAQSLGPVDLALVMAQMAPEIAGAVEATGAEVTWNGLPRVEGDELQLRQLLENLVLNAVKFRGEEPPRVSVTAERAGGLWRISVRDNGIGIAPEHRERIFEIFQRLHGRRGYPGTGIGLAICKRIVERHGGAIWVESEPGAGSTFHFTLRRAAEVSP